MRTPRGCLEHWRNCELHASPKPVQNRRVRKDTGHPTTSPPRSRDADSRRRVGAQEDLLPAEAVSTEPNGPGSRLTATSAPTGRGKLVHRSVGHALAELNRAYPPRSCDHRCSSGPSVRSQTGPTRRSGRCWPTGISHRYKQQDGAHRQEELARRSEHEATEPDRRDDHARPRRDRVDSADVHGQSHDEHRERVPGDPAGEHHATGEPRPAEREAGGNRHHDHCSEPNPGLHLHCQPPDANR